MTGTAWIEESGFAESPILITNTHSVGLVRDAVIKWQVNEAAKGRRTMPLWSLPIVAETWDGFLNDINGFHVQEEHVFAALNGAKSGAVPEGAVGGGTGMVCYGFKGGIGTSSRKLAEAAGGFSAMQLRTAPTTHDCRRAGGQGNRGPRSLRHEHCAERAGAGIDYHHCR